MSPDYGWMRSKTRDPETGQFKTARNLLKAGKKREGYQTTQDIIDQSTCAMDILDEDYADEKHVLAYNNATVHTARAPDALSATKMIAKQSENFNKVKNDDGTTRLIRMRAGKFRDTPQSLYLPNGQFKGMKQIIQERGEKGHDLPDPDAPDPNSSRVAFPVFVESMVHPRRAEQTDAFSWGMCTAYIEVTDFEPAMPLYDTPPQCSNLAWIHGPGNLQQNKHNTQVTDKLLAHEHFQRLSKCANLLFWTFALMLAMFYQVQMGLFAERQPSLVWNFVGSVFAACTYPACRNAAFGCKTSANKYGADGTRDHGCIAISCDMDDSATN
ncbi:hypothetical protein B0H14DRAFT_3463770 [Mycena olivaceomarginata]|nr:hypothetical protein B0H14DRAFT_3463770 [Mycena olivaceomarginata]